jgi:hypothetical protein
MKSQPIRFFLLLFLFFSAFNHLNSQNSLIEDQVINLQQAGVVFESFPSLFTTKSGYKEPKNDLERNAQRLRLNKSVLGNVESHRPEAIRLSVPFNGQILEIDLYKAPALTDNFTVMSGNWVQQSYRPGVYYRGVIKGVSHSLAAISFFDNEMMGVIAHPEWGNLNLGHMDGNTDDTDYVLYSDAFLPPMPFADCVARESGEPTKPPEMNAPEVAGCVRIFFEADYALYLNKGSVSGTVNYVTGFFNVIAAIYANEAVSIAMSQVYVWTSPDSYSTSSSGTALNQFVSFRTLFDGDLAHLTALGGNGLGGVAYLNVLCNNSLNYGYSNINSTFQAFPTYSWTINVVAHELGHNFSSNHTHWCGWPGGAIDNCGPTAGYPTEGTCADGPVPTNGGTIMSYCHLVGGVGVNFSNGFGTNPGNAIRTATTSALNATCIVATCPSGSCTAPTALTVTALTISSATIGWDAVGGALSYDLQYRTAGNGTWTTVVGATNPFVINGLIASTLYEVQVRTNCSGSSSPYFVGALFKTNSSPCPEPSGLNTTAVSSTSVSLNWTENGSSTSWDVQYGLSGFSLGAGTIVNTSVRPYLLAGLIQATIYSYYVRSTCGGGLGNSSWVGPFVFTTPLANDLSTGAITLVVNQACTGNVYTNEGSGVTAGEFSPSVANGGYWNTGTSNTVWFKFLAPASGSVLVTTDVSPLGTLEDTQIALYNNESPATIDNLLVSNEDGGVLSPGYAAYGYYSGLTSGIFYYIQVDGWSADIGNFCIEVKENFALPSPSTCTSYTQTSVTGNTAPDKWFNIYTKPNSADIGLPVAAVKSSVNLGTVTVQEIKNATVPTSASGIKYMQRYYNFECTQNAAVPKQIRLFYTNTELDALKTATGLLSNIAEDLNISHYDGINENCVPSDNANTGFSAITAVAAQSIGSSGYFYLDYTSPSFSEMGAMFGTVALPLDLLSFTGAAEFDFNAVQWTVDHEKAVLGYDLQRSVNGHDQWESVNHQPAGLRNYAFGDKNPAQVSYYRLSVEEADGKIYYSSIITIVRATIDGIQGISPNPAQQTIFVEYNAAHEQPVLFRIYGYDGRLLSTQQIDILKGTNFIPFDIALLPPGIYYCTTNSGRGMQFVKL